MIELCKALVCLPFDLLSIILFGEMQEPEREPVRESYVIPIVSTYKNVRAYYCLTHNISTDEFERKVDSNGKYRPDYIREQMATKGICIIDN